MSNPGESDPTPITSTRQMAEWFAAGCKPKSAWRIGTEHEKFGFRLSDYTPPPYEPQGIRAMLEGLMAKGWEPILDRGNPIGLKRRSRCPLGPWLRADWLSSAGQARRYALDAEGPLRDHAPIHAACRRHGP